MRTRTAVGLWIEKERGRAGLTQMELAAKADLHLQTIFGIETGRIRRPGLETMQKIVAALGRTLADLPALDGKRSTRRT